MLYVAIVTGVAWLVCLFPTPTVRSGQTYMVKTKLGKGLWGRDGERSSQKKRRVPVKCIEPPKDVSVDWIFQEVGAETELEMQESYGVGGNNFKR